jgi:lysophospholipase L1-like esterase
VIRNALLALASVGVALAICEGFLRLFADEMLPDPGVYVMDPDVGKRMRPGWTGDEFGAPVRINSHGLRQPETGWEKPPGTYRILALGDSWTFGFRTENRDSYPRQLERILREGLRERGSRTSLEVINAGVVGYSTAQEAAYLRVTGYRYAPDLVIVAFYPVNDAEDKITRYVRYQRLREFHPWLLEVWRFPRSLYLRQFIKGSRRALKWNLARLRVSTAERLGREDPGASAILEADWTYRFRSGNRGWELARDGLREIGETTRRIGARGLVVLLPDLTDLARYEDRYHPRIEPLIHQAVEGSGLDWLDLVAHFAPLRGREDEVRLAGYRHPNANGYRHIARAVAEAVEARYPLQAAAAP